MPDTEIQFASERLGRNRFAVTLLIGNEVKVARELNPLKSDQRTAFIEEVKATLPGLNGELLKIEAELLQLTSPGQKRRPAADDLVFDPKDPLPIAREFRRVAYTLEGDTFKLVCDGTTFDRWDGAKYVDQPEAAIRSELYAMLEHAKKWVKRSEGLALAPFAPTQSAVNNIEDALRAITYTKLTPPAWLNIDASDRPDPTMILATPTGLLHLRRHGSPELVGPPTPLFYSRNAIDFAYQADAPAPLQWLRFLDELWPDDPESVELLQEWAGYVLTPDTRQQKALLLVGPKRAGKGTIARILTRLIGESNVCGPTLSGMATNFGLWSFVGKLLAIVSDARLSGRSDQAAICERILALTGEDSLTIDRKNLQPITVRLPTRLMILTNELPRLSDSSGALASRFMVLNLTKSFYGREDTSLETHLIEELPGILNWAIAGWQRLQARGHFHQPATSAEAVQELSDLASPIGAFVRDLCVVHAGASIPRQELYQAWGAWCKEQGREPGEAATFGRNLKAAFSCIGSAQPKTDEGRIRTYEGISLSLSGQVEVSRLRGTEAFP